MKNFVLKNEERTKVFGNPNRLLSHCRHQGQGDQNNSVLVLQLNSTQLNVNLRTQVKHLIFRIYLSKLNTKLYVTYYSY